MPDDPLDSESPLATELAQQRSLLVAVRGITERLSMQYTSLRQAQSLVQHTLTQHSAQLERLQQTLEAVKGLLERAGGH